MIVKNTIRNLILIIIGIVIVVSFIWKAQPLASPKSLTPQPTLALPTNSKPALRASIDTRHLEVNTFKIPTALKNKHNFLLVSAASIDESYVALADYSNLYCLNTQNASIE